MEQRNKEKKKNTNYRILPPLQIVGLVFHLRMLQKQKTINKNGAAFWLHFKTSSLCRRCYHALLMMQKIVSESNDPHMLLTELVKQKHREDLTENTGAVLAKYLPKVKLEREFLQL